MWEECDVCSGKWSACDVCAVGGGVVMCVQWEVECV